MSKYTGTPPAVLCDLDGTLLDTETLSTQALNEVIGKWGKVCDWTLKKRLLGLKGLDWTKIVIDDLNLSDVITPAEMVAGWEEALGRLYPQAAVLAGASRLCAHLKRHSIPSAIVTSSNSHAVAEKRLHNEELFSCFPVVVAGDDRDVERGKPAPDMYLLAARRLGVSTVQQSCCLVFEDALSGVCAGVAAGMRVIAVPDTRLDPEPFLAAGAAVVLTSLERFRPEEWGLPPYDDII